MADSTKYSGSSTGDNLDITQLGNEDLDQLASQIESFYAKDGTIKTALSYSWDRNMRYLDGDQWIVFDGDRSTGGQWSRLSTSRANDYIPRPVTNYIFDAYQTLKSYLIRNKPRSTVSPNSQSSKDKTAAKIAELCNEANWERLKEQDNYEYAAACLVTYGTVFKKSFWDSSSQNMVRVPRYTQQPQMDPQTGQVIGITEVEALDEAGVPIYDILPLGDVNTKVVEPYRIALDPQATDINTLGWIMEYSIQPLAHVQQLYSKEGEGYTGAAAEIKPEAQLSNSMRRFYQLKNSSGVKNTGSLESAAGTAGDTQITNSVILKEYYERPSQKHPKGRLVVVASGKTLFAGDSPYEGGEAGDWHPYSECRWEIVPGRFWGKSPLDAACEIQKHVNSIDSVIILTRKTMAVPQKLIPFGSGIEPGSWTGRPGQQIPYREVSGSAPSIIPAAGVDQSVFLERQQRVEDIKNVTGAIDILKGDRPQGVNAASAINLLFEIGTGKLFPVYDRWKRLVENDQKKQLKIISKFYKEPRDQFIRLLKQKGPDISHEAISRFIGTDLLDNTTVVVEAGSNVPKLQAAKQARLEQAALAGALNLDLPQNRLEYNKQMGITGFDNDVGPDIKRADWENDILDGTATNPDNQTVVLEFDDHNVHIQRHHTRMKEPSWLELPEETQMAYLAHVAQHEQFIQLQLQQQQMEQMATGMPIQQEPSGIQPSPSPGKGNGASMKVRNAVQSADLPPGAME